MTELWYPVADRSVPATSDAGPFQGGAPKTLLHTTESDTAAPAFGVFQSKGFWPHFTATIESGQFHIYQHIALDKAGKALEHPPGTGITNTDNVIQIEIVGHAANAANFPKVMLDGLRDWVRWVEANHGTAHQAQPFPGPRLDWQMWDAYSGIVGHVHVPNNTHTDPGAIDINYLLSGPQPTPPPQEEDVTHFYKIRDESHPTQPAPSPKGDGIWVTTDTVTTHVVSGDAWTHMKNLGWWDESKLELIPEALHNWFVANDKGQNEG